MLKRRMIAVVLGVLMLFMAACATPAPAAPDSPPTGETPDTAGPTEPEVPDWPGERHITILNASVVGSANDILSREFGRAVELMYPGSVLNTVNTGAGGALFGALLGAPTDGSTIASVNSAQIASLHAMQADFPFENFEFIGNVQMEPFIIAVRTEAPFQTLEELIEYAQANPGFTIGGTGTGTMNHLLTIELSRMAEFDYTWIPFAGGAEAVTNLLGGHVDAIVNTPASVRPQMDAGNLIILAATGTQRSQVEAYRDIPTFMELGFYLPQIQYRGFMVRAGLDPALKQRMSDVIREATQYESFLNYMDMFDMDDAFMDHVEFTELVTNDFIRVGEMLAALENNN